LTFAGWRANEQTDQKALSVPIQTSKAIDITRRIRHPPTLESDPEESPPLGFEELATPPEVPELAGRDDSRVVRLAAVATATAPLAKLHVMMVPLIGELRLPGLFERALVPCGGISPGPKKLVWTACVAVGIAMGLALQVAAAKTSANPSRPIEATCSLDSAGHCRTDLRS
jgi:hypothetical protein